jgi:hypothetical protein
MIAAGADDEARVPTHRVHEWGMHMHRLLAAEALARILIARWQRMARNTLAARQRREDVSRDPQPPRAVRRLP